MILPNLVGPTNTTDFTHGSFGGTSCATPNAAGTAAAFWSSAPALSAAGVRHLLFEQAGIFRDWGDPGHDNIYGRGDIRLHTYHDNTVWVDRRFFNIFGSPMVPYFYVAHAQAAAVSGGRIVFLGQSYPEPVTLNKNFSITLKVRGPVLYATHAKGGTLVFNRSNFRALKPAGWYQQPLWSSCVSMEGDVGVAIADDKRSLQLFSKQAVSPDLTKLQRFASKR